MLIWMDGKDVQQRSFGIKHTSLQPSLLAGTWKTMRTDLLSSLSHVHPCLSVVWLQIDSFLIGPDAVSYVAHARLA